ncbi:pyridoxamine 5'-phosphate oxidase family protein [Pseudoscardovia suis]|jgi:predicted pyridoxine 5'-phosphate oxidase superfamily flavin-nucleotide-binding protein|uniref:pyridoxamine 5'-phosphate oxidase family protein n=1 Tax=Pseudoscardovia suis TaxID=987063 RepID=UPI003F95B81A|nr:pyridoxamine 5'-phosphate oxidase family protein [Bifidobacteriaceae bacterium]
MVAMTDDMKSMIANNLCYIATVDESGYPDIGPKISMQVKDDSHLFYYERTARQHLHNLRDNGKMVVAVATKDNKHGYRFHGPVELVDSGDFYEEALKFADEHGLKRPAVVPVMTITRIDLLDAGPKAGTIIAQD